MDIASLMKALLNGIFPHHCPLCSLPSYQFLCPACFEDLPRITLHCRVCSLPLYSVDVTVCGECQTHQPSFDRVIAAFSFESPVGHFINRFKHQGRFDALPVLTNTLLDSVRTEPDRPDLVTSVPLHWTTLLRRGFNQSEIIARRLAKEMELPYRTIATKSTRTGKQQALSRRERLRNLKQVFRLRANVAGKHIALVDDVVTTGATAETLARLLKHHGARRVDVWALARTPKH